MKYGETLPLFSAPQFANYNLEYNAVKELIKQRTTGSELVADPSIKTEFDDEIFGLLVQQLESLNLFVKCKAGELKRRLESIERILASSKLRDGNLSSYKLYSRYQKLERDVESIGNDIQALSRFRESNRIGFVKLLKKYKKWTGSGTLSRQFLPLLSDSQSFTKHDLDGLLNRMMAVLEDVRKGRADIPSHREPTALQVRLSNESLPLPRKQPNTALEFDAQLDVGKYSRATYWVSYASIIELQIIISKSLTARTSSTPVSTVQTPVTEIAKPLYPSSTVSERLPKDDDVGEVVYEDEAAYLERIRLKLGDGKSDHHAPSALIRWIDNSETPDIALVIPEVHSTQIISGSRKLVNSLLTGKISKRIEGSQFAKHHAKNTNMRPLVTVKASRSRFVGPSITNPSIWATLDRDVRISKVSQGANWNSGLVGNFPYAVLSIYWEKDAEAPNFLEYIDSSHLAVRVPEFSIEAHAVATLYKADGSHIPSWFGKLSEELFKRPPAPLIKLSRPKYGTKRNSSPLRDSSTSAASISNGEYSSLTTYSTEPTTDEDTGKLSPSYKTMSRNALGKMPKSNVRANDAWLGQNRYWSELNDEETEEDQPFTILVHESDSSSSVVESFKQSFLKFIGHRKRTDGEHEPLLGSTDASAAHDSDLEHGISAYEDTSNEHTLYTPSARKGYIYGYTLCFFLSYACLALSAFFVFREPKKKHSQEAWFNYTLRVALSVSASLCLDVSAISLFIARRRVVGWIHTTAVYGAFTLICLCSGAVLAMVENNQL